MTLTTHGVVGGVIGALLSQNPVLASVAAFASHFALDMIPHWDYELSSTAKDEINPLNTTVDTKGEAFLKDLFKTGFDALLGLVIVILLFISSPRQILIGAILGVVFGILPDALQFVYWKIRREPLISLQKFHVMIQSSKTQKWIEDKAVLGISLQLAIIIIVVLLGRYLL